MTILDAAPNLDTRRRYILDILNDSGQIAVADLAQQFGVSCVTIRSDLDYLEQNGKLKRTHGGAIPLTQRVTISTQDKRLNVNVDAKRRIAQRTAQLVQNGDTLLVDSGTTTLEFVKALGTKQDLTVITADLTIADTIDRMYEDIDVIMLGGSLRAGHRYTAGPVAMATLNSLFANKAFVCPTSFIAGKGAMTNYLPMAEVKSALIANAQESYLLIDSSKIEKPGLITFASLSSFSGIISNCTETSPLAEEAQSCGVPLLLV